MISKALFILSFAWSIARGLKEASLSLLFALKARSGEPVIELIVPAVERKFNMKNTVHFFDYLQQKQAQEVLVIDNDNSPRTQKVRLAFIPGKIWHEFYLN